MAVTNSLALAREQQVFVIEETTKGTIEEPTSADLVRIINAPTLNQQAEYYDDEQFRDTRSKQNRIRGRFPAGDWDLETYIKPSGTAGTAPEVDALLECGLGGKRSRIADTVTDNASKVDVVTDGSNSTTKAYFADASTFKVGMVVSIVQTTPDATSLRTILTVDTDDDFITWTEALAEAVDDDTDITQADNTTTTFLCGDASIYTIGDAISITVGAEAEVVHVTAVSTTLERVTVSPAMSEAAALSDVIAAGIHYICADDPKSMSIWHYVGHTMFVISGASVDSLKMDVQGKDTGKFTFSGKFMKKIHTGTDEVGSGGIDDSATTLPVLDSTKYSVGSIIYVASEIMKVSAMPTATTITVSRAYKSSSAAAHIAGVAITPWYPSGGADVGDPAHGRLGYFSVDGDNVSVLGASIEVTNGVKYYEEEKTGTDYSEDFDAVENRDVKASVELFLRTNDLKYFNYAVEQTQSIVVVPCGNEEGETCIARMPLCEWSSPALSSDTEIKAAVDMAALASTTGNDELVISFI